MGANSNPQLDKVNPMADCLTLDDVCFGITAFQRPHLLTQLVHSILRNYPLASIVVADNGRKKAVLPDNVRVLNLPFDCGLSAARNALTRAVKTKLMLLLEEDFFFLPSTRIEPLLEVLNHDAEVGVVGGGMLAPSGQTVAYAMDIEVFRDTMCVRESNHRQRVTSSGTPYRICDLIWNFALFRKEMLADHAWDETLKVGEHTPYFNEVRKAARWRVACCPETVIHHVPDRRSDEYRSYRLRARELFHQYLRRNGLCHYQRIAPRTFENPLPGNANVVVLGVGHSGTSVAAKMLHHAGWQKGDADKRFGESIGVRGINEQALKSGWLSKPAASRALQRLPEPWAIKDPRFVWTLSQWLPAFASLPRPPILLRIRREHRSVVNSYRRRRVRGDIEAMVRERQTYCEWQFERWPWQKFSVQFEQLVQAIKLFDVRRAESSSIFGPAAALTGYGPGGYEEHGNPADDAYAMTDGSPDHLFTKGQAFGLHPTDDGSPELYDRFSGGAFPGTESGPIPHDEEDGSSGRSSRFFSGDGSLEWGEDRV
jgi:hypothetical protein